MASEPSLITTNQISDTKVARKWRNPLPDDFLILPNGHEKLTSQQEYQDAMLAQMLQNELFMEQLKSHPDYMAYVEAERRALGLYTHDENYPTNRSDSDKSIGADIGDFFKKVN